MARFCSSCGAALNEGARFCHVCGVAVGAAGPGAVVASTANKMFWAPIVVSLVAVVGLVAAQFGSIESAPEAESQVIQPPDISQMTPQQQADRLFDRVMRMSEEGKADSAAFFAPMAMGAIEALGPLDAHRRYDIGLIALVSGDAPMAAAQADTILKTRPTHLLGLILAAKAAIARNDNAAAAKLWQRLVAAESKELATPLPEYIAHDADVKGGLDRARQR